ncbi:glycosyl hydrolase family 5 [Enterovirga sp.]|uniref:glycosyl hydrolase family 5 n=1 Tax=Enterovirga sp. TaxID=2026350 RepID=UPI002C7EC6BF|nr:glycosyl hydrolase family 5 [Enterovirga sp.]HMO29922.1 glycosyl hydrolase family 5 [Enterovirga sp.]
MKRALIAMAVAGLTYAAIPTAAEASPLMPQQGLVLGQNLASNVAWHRRCWRDRWGRMRCRTCRRDRWGRMICR